MQARLMEIGWTATHRCQRRHRQTPLVLRARTHDRAIAPTGQDSLDPPARVVVLVLQLPLVIVWGGGDGFGLDQPVLSIPLIGPCPVREQIAIQVVDKGVGLTIGDVRLAERAAHSTGTSSR